MPLTMRRDKAQRNVKRHAGWHLTPSICWMKVECRGAIANARAPKASKIFDHFFRCCGSTPSRSGARSGGQNQKWPTSGQGGHITPAARGVPSASERGAQSEVAHKWARWLHNPYHLGGPLCFRAGGRIRSGSSQKWKILIFWGHATKRGFQSGGTISEIAHKWAQWQSEVGKLIKKYFT